jgi:hypothetical protein
VIKKEFLKKKSRKVTKSPAKESVDKKGGLVEGIGLEGIRRKRKKKNLDCVPKELLL